MRFNSKKDKPNGESHRALAAAEQHVLQIKAQSEEVTEVAAALRSARKQNHFAEQISIIFGKKV